MTNQQELFQGVFHCTVDHIAIQTRFGRMIPAVTLFEKLGFTEHKAGRKTGVWGEARFMVKPGTITIQLTTPSLEIQLPSSETHLALLVQDAELVSKAIKQWGELGGLAVEIEEDSPGQIFVTLTDILTIPLELISANKK